MIHAESSSTDSSILQNQPALDFTSPAESLADTASIMIWIQGADKNLYYVNKPWLDFTGRTLQQEINGAWIAGIHEDERDTFLFECNKAFDAREPFKMEYRLLRHDGQYRWLLDTGHPRYNKDGEFLGFIGSCVDIHERKENEMVLSHKALYDSLTGLANRDVLLDKLDLLIRQYAEKSIETYGVLFLDLDRFKIINDSLGHVAGDEVLKMFAAKISIVGSEQTLIARLSGDEFAIVCWNMSQQDVVQMARQIKHILSQPFEVQDKKVYVNVSIGIATAQYEWSSPEEVIRSADIAMYKAKTRGGGSFEIFSSQSSKSALDFLELENDLREALTQNQFELYYQPIYVLGSQRMVYEAEALLRWNHPTKGWVLPGEFLPVADRIGMSVAIDTWVLKAATEQAYLWQSALASPIIVSINLSHTFFKWIEGVEIIEKALKESGLRPENLEIELSENGLVNDAESLENIFNLKKLGVKIAIDDFGIGYSSLAYLKQLPIDKLKIDQSFIQDSTQDEKSSAIVESIINLGHRLGLLVVSEGIETKQQLDLLHQYGSDLGQGNFLHKPLNAQEFCAVVSENQGLIKE
jgi:diguanylate cyclase (GGDEF)-like protein/PAS domain S-box-containing protein